MITTSTALIVGLDAATCDSFGPVLEAHGFETLRVTTGRQAVDVLHRARPALIVLDLDTQDVPALVLLRQCRASDASAVVLAVAAVPDVRTAVEAMRAGAADVLETTVTPEALRDAIERLLPPGLPAAEHEHGRLFHGSAAMQKLEAIVAEVARLDGPVLIEGERGVGKADVAWAIHRLSARRSGPHVRLDCAALPPDLLETELFGREEVPAAAGDGSRVGKLEAAHTGTLLLEEVREVPAPLQLRLVQVLKGGEFFRAGGRGLTSADVRLLVTSRTPAATDRPILEELRDELGVFRILVPPLRERREEIPGLAEYYRERFAREFGRAAAPLSASTLQLLGRYQWPGNVHELANVIKRYVVLTDERHLVDEIRGRMQATGSAPVRPRPGELGGIPIDVKLGLREIARRAARAAEREVIEHVLTSVNWNRAEAARRLKVSYKTMLKKLGEDERGTSSHGTRAPRDRARSA